MTLLCNVYANNIKNIIYVITTAGSYKSLYTVCCQLLHQRHSTGWTSCRTARLHSSLSDGSTLTAYNAVTGYLVPDLSKKMGAFIFQCPTTNAQVPLYAGHTQSQELPWNWTSYPLDKTGPYSVEWFYVATFYGYHYTTVCYCINDTSTDGVLCHKYAGHHQGSSSCKDTNIVRFNNGRFFQNVFCMTDWPDDIQSTVNCCTTDAVLNSCVNNTISIYSISQWDEFHINFTVLLHFIKS
jgi:hypothetical protein